MPVIDISSLINSYKTISMQLSLIIINFAKYEYILKNLKGAFFIITYKKNTDKMY